MDPTTGASVVIDTLPSCSYPHLIPRPDADLSRGHPRCPLAQRHDHVAATLGGEPLADLQQGGGGDETTREQRLALSKPGRSGQECWRGEPEIGRQTFEIEWRAHPHQGKVVALRDDPGMHL